MNAKKLQEELEESLVRGLDLWMKDNSPSLAPFHASLIELMKERARNLAMGLASRVVSESQLDSCEDIDSLIDKKNEQIKWYKKEYLLIASMSGDRDD